MVQIYAIVCDEHRRDGKEDDPFLAIKDDYAHWREKTPTRKYHVVHNGDTHDCIMGQPAGIYAAHKDVRRYETKDFFTPGNHELWNMDLLSPGIVRDDLTIYGYRVLHGHELFSFWNDPRAKILTAHLGWFYRYYQGNPLADGLYKWAQKSHRDNALFWPKLLALGITMAVFAHSHSLGRGGEYWNPGDLPSTRTAVILDRAGARFERVF